MDRTHDIDGRMVQPAGSGEPEGVQAAAGAEPSPVPTDYWTDLPAGTPRIAIISNPRSHGNRSRSYEAARAAADAARAVLVTPRGRNQIAPVLRDFARSGIDYLIVDGGDGTMRDVLTAGAPVFGPDWPCLAILPRGKTNVLAEDLGIPRNWDVSDALAAHTAGHTKRRRPLTVTSKDVDAPPVVGFIMGGGSFTRGVSAAQDAHRLGAFGRLAIGLTAAWGAVQTIFGGNRNPWRRGTGMEIRLDPDGTPMPHSGHGETDRRSIMLASTLHTMPMGLTVFGPARGGLKLAAIDRPRRMIWAAMPLLLKGWQPNWLADWGYHRADPPGFDIVLDDEFILDGEVFAAGAYRVDEGDPLEFVVPPEA